MYRRILLSWILILSLTPVVAYIMLYYNNNPEAAPKPLLWAISITVLVFYKSTVLVIDNRIKVMFGVGFLRKMIKLSDVEICTSVENISGFGWGITWALRGWLYNTSDFNAVELKLKNGRIYRIGTDKPEDLCNFINAKLMNSKQ